MISTAVKLKNKLTILDKCDKCGVQAYVKVVLKNEKGVLFFCGHHARINKDKMKGLIYKWFDETNRIYLK